MRSQNNDPRIENDTALWAIAIAFANPNFANYINVNTPEVKQTLSEYPDNTMTLYGRHDLVLHFLYSAIIERLGNRSFSVQVGELKELYDANLEGSGFDFSDLAADRAGAVFSLFLSSSIDNAKRSQNLLADNDDESFFFPDITRLPAPIKNRDFNALIGSTQTERYKDIVEMIDQKIDHLLLYRGSDLSR